MQYALETQSNAANPRIKARNSRVAFWISLSLALLPTHGFTAPRADPRYNYAEMFELTRGVMTRPTARKLLDELFANQLQVNPELAAKYGFTGTKVKSFTETQLMLLLQDVPVIREEIRNYLKEVPAKLGTDETPELQALREKWKNRFTEVFRDKELLKEFFEKNDPLEPFVMEMPPGKKGFGRLETYLTYPINLKGKVRPADDVEQALVDFIKSAEYEIRFNVFDFDLDSVADALIDARKRGVNIMGGIDAGVIETRPEVKAIFEKLRKARIPVEAVDSVGLNHQKLIVVDYKHPGKARVAMSTGNFTQSCLSPRGDMAGKLYTSPKSIPNANMLKIVQSDELAIVVHHELTKTIDPVFALRGKTYPISGAYEIMGGPIGNETKRSITIAFTPNGGLGDINENFIGRMIGEIPGPSYTAQFAWSSKKSAVRLLDDAKASVKSGKPFVLHAVGDTPFAMQSWSIFQWIAGLQLVGEGGKKGYVILPDAENEWLQALGNERYQKLLGDLRIAPLRYGNSSVQTVDGAFKLTSKLHLKIFVKGENKNLVGIFGSFNFSEGAENNQEYIVAIRDNETNEIMKSSVMTLSDESPRSVREEAMRRNTAREFEPPEGDQVDAPKAGRNAKDVRVDCNKILRRPTVGLNISK